MVHGITRRDFIKYSAGTVAYFSLGGTLIADTGVDYWAPWVTKLKIDAATINWRGTSDGSGSIEFC